MVVTSYLSEEHYNHRMDVYPEHYKPAISIANYLTYGSKSAGEQTLGFELEHFVVEEQSLAPVPYQVDPASDAPSVEKLLSHIKQHYSETVFEDDTEGTTHLFGLAREKAAITLEPGSQLEISIGPAHSLKEIEDIYLAFRAEIDPVLKRMGLQLLELGYHPSSQARDVSLLPKRRYQYMDEYFKQTGNHGICMMRATASTQVSIDFKDEADALKKLRVANSLGPLFAFVTDNAPIFEGEQVAEVGGTSKTASSGLTVPSRMARMACWDDTDAARSLVIEESFDEDFSFLRYATTLLEAPGIFLPDWYEGDAPEYLGFTPYAQVLPDAFIDEELVLHILSLFFFDARFKTYLELRQADSLPLEYALAYTALVKGIFYSQTALDHYASSFVALDASMVAAAKSALRLHGYEALVYGRPATEWLDEMLALASEGLSSDEKSYLEPLRALIKARTTLLDTLG